MFNLNPKTHYCLELNENSHIWYLFSVVYNMFTSWNFTYQFPLDSLDALVRRTLWSSLWTLSNCYYWSVSVKNFIYFKALLVLSTVFGLHFHSGYKTHLNRALIFESFLYFVFGSCVSFNYAFIDISWWTIRIHVYYPVFNAQRDMQDVLVCYWY